MVASDLEIREAEVEAEDRLQVTEEEDVTQVAHRTMVELTGRDPAREEELPPAGDEREEPAALGEDDGTEG